MTPNQLARWQWADYDQFHQDSGNRAIHGVAVPLVWLGTVGLLVALANGAWPWMLPGAAAVVLGMALQGMGHKREARPPIPFSSPTNAIARLLMEQFFTYPRFVLSGRAFSRKSSAGG
jgi:uncharacterized membrane protein YGL010W